jgi:hypothetical protein
MKIQKKKILEPALQYLTSYYKDNLFSTKLKRRRRRKYTRISFQGYKI